MAAIPVLKKKLKSIKATEKLSKAMKTVSAAKFSKLSSIWKNYLLYNEQYKLFVSASDNNKVCETVIIIGSSRSFCGSFNNETLNFYKENFTEKPENLIVCGEQMSTVLSENKIKADYCFEFSDTPIFSECEPLFELLDKLCDGKKDYLVKIIHNHYKNTLTQIPVSEVLVLNPTSEMSLPENLLWVPDCETIKENLLKKSFRTTVFGAVLETALGAQAATLMTMRSAYDTATEYSAKIEGEIQRTRQSKVTADVIETRGKLNQ